MSPLPRPLVDAHTAADLIGETEYLTRTLKQAQVATPGATGVLNRVAPSTVWIVGEVAINQLADEIAGSGARPEVMVPAGEDALTESLTQIGWRAGRVVERLRCDLPGTSPADQLSRNTAVVRTARHADLPKLRALHVEAFNDDDAADYLPDSVLDIPDLEILVAESTNEPPALLGTAGIRLRHEGALLFGLATASDQRRRGIASLVVAECLAWAKEQGSPYVLADVDTPAPRLWAELGFRVASRWRRCNIPNLR